MTRILSIYFQKLPEEYRRREGLSRLLKWAYSFSPNIALDKAPSPAYKNNPIFCGVNIDIKASTKLFAGEQAISSCILEELSSFRINAKLCIAPTLGSAWALSRYQSDASSIISHKELKQAIGPLPLAALRLEQKSIDTLNELNIRHISHLLAIPTKELKIRFTKEVVIKLQQAIGTIQEPLESIRFTKSLSAKCSFSTQSGGYLESQQALLYHLKELLKELIGKCQAEQQQVLELSLSLSFIRSPSLTKNCRTLTPTNDFKHLWKILKQIVESCPAELGVEEIKLCCISSESQRCEFSSFIPGHQIKRQSKETSKLLDSLYTNLGTKRVCSLAICESHIPEKSFYYFPKQDQQFHNLEMAKLAQITRPTLLYSPPQTLSAIAALPDSPPRWLKWNNRKHYVKKGIGPERIEAQWWTSLEIKDSARDYFRLQLEDGLWLWVYRDCSTHRWFLHGLWS